MNCPHCDANLKGEPIDPKHFIHEDDCDDQKARWASRYPDDTPRCFCLPYGDKPVEERFFSRIIGIEIRGVYDGVLFWQCPDCGGRWQRWSEHDMMAKAQPYIDGVDIDP